MTTPLTRLGTELNFCATQLPSNPFNQLRPVTKKIIQACGGLARFHSLPEIAFKPKFLGNTQYIKVGTEDLKESSLNVVRGKDPFGRTFLCLKTEVQSLRIGSNSTPEKGVITLFQRYAPKQEHTPDIWVCTSNDLIPFFNPISNPQSAEIQTLETLLKGKQAPINYLGDKAFAWISQP